MALAAGHLYVHAYDYTYTDNKENKSEKVKG